LNPWQPGPKRPFSPDAQLCLFRSEGSTWASVEKGVAVKGIENRPYFFKRVAVVGAATNEMPTED